MHTATILIIVSFLAIYFIPSFVGRKKRNALPIFLVNLFFGWCILGWVVALVMALWDSKYTGEYHPTRQGETKNTQNNTLNYNDNSTININ